MKLSDLISLISSLRNQSKKQREQSERKLVLTACSGSAVILSTVIGWICYYFFQSGLALSAGTILSAGVLIPLGLLFGNYWFNSLKARWVTSGNIFERLKYLDNEFSEDLKTIQNLGLNEDMQRHLIEERYEKYLEDIKPFREQVKTLQNPWETSLTKHWPRIEP